VRQILIDVRYARFLIPQRVPNALLQGREEVRRRLRGLVEQAEHRVVIALERSIPQDVINEQTAAYQRPSDEQCAMTI
jgi:sugar-specific transcriptional regulator TrmB